MKVSHFSLTLASILAAGFASAQSYITTGELSTSDPVFNRPSGPTSLSSVGTAVAYDVYAFTVSASGLYTAEVSSPDSTLDTYLLVYSSFTPGSPLNGLIDGDDDYNGSFSVLGGTSPGTFRGSRISAGETTNYVGNGLSLTAGTTYYAVATSFDNATTTATGLGSYTLGIGGGPGTVSPVPEPATMAALGLGVAAMLRRRKSA